MFKRTMWRPAAGLLKGTRGAFSLTLIFILIEFFDELHYGVQGATLPALRADLHLSYAQIGLLLGLPLVIGTFLEPVLMLLGDTGLRKRLIIAGGLAIICALFLIASADSFPAVLVAMILSFPAGGAFVSLSQATLMDMSPGREAQMMARWTVAGSLGNLLGPLLVAGGFALAFGWRWAFVALAALALLLLLAIWARPFPGDGRHRPRPEVRTPPISDLLANLWQALRSPFLLRWIVLLELSDLLLDVFTGYAALYFTDVVGATPAQTSLLLTVLMSAGLVADLALIPLLERIPGRSLVRASAFLAIGVYIAWLLVPWPLAKAVLLVAIRFSTMGWYQVLQGEAYASLPGRSGTVMAVNSLGGLMGGALAWLIGWIASQVGLPAAMWLLLLGPVSLVLFMPKQVNRD